MTQRVGRGPWGGGGSLHELDLATAVLPQLLYERLDELGIDFSVIYPSSGCSSCTSTTRRTGAGTCRALNRCNAGLRRADRSFVPVAAIPMHTPDEAIAELEHAARARVQGRGHGRLRAASDRRGRRRSTPSSRSTRSGSTCSASTARTTTTRCGRSAASSASPPPSTRGRSGWQNRQSISSYVFNHVGMLGRGPARAGQVAVPRRRHPAVPELNFAFLEGGVAWAASLYADLDRPLGEAQRRRDRATSTPRASTAACSASCSPSTAPDWAGRWRRRPASYRPAEDADDCSTSSRRAASSGRGHPRAVRRPGSSSAARPTTR